ncbi:hypothetical protein LEL86_32435 [Streptomyces sp. WA6-1-16]|uniref:hypothetical protein n=1 Tax=Streptomyces sp. WA6-1-16 TaxID=2879427 RepID=UPI001CE37CEB|nr:hypothetical protein [Streptomyces sp. WA6-1-16]UCA53703.1 hypothetical protein LEL86_32435 [Streptomyces sp. WA6-1-16]
MAVAEDAVRESGAEWTILRPNQFFQNFDEYLWRAPLGAGRLGLPIGDMPEPFVDADDVAADADALGAMFALHRAGHSAEVTDGVRQVLGREAADLEPWARRIAATGVWA